MITTHNFIHSSFYGFIDTYELKKIPTNIGNDVWIGLNSTILAGVKIGNGSVIGANSVVTKDVEDYAIYAGNPAKLIKYRFDERLIQLMNDIQWWELDTNIIKDNIHLFSSKLTKETLMKIQELC